MLQYFSIEHCTDCACLMHDNQSTKYFITETIDELISKLIVPAEVKT